MNKLYLAMCIVFGSVTISANRVDDPMAKVPLTGTEYIHQFMDATGNSSVAMSMYKIETTMVKNLLTPSSDGIYDLRGYELELRKQVLKNGSWFGRHKGKLGLAIGLMGGSFIILAAFFDGFMENYGNKRV